MAQADSKTTKARPHAPAKRLPKKVWKAAALKFEPCKIDLERLPNNEEFGKQMVYVRLAAVFLTETKPKIVEMITKFAQSDEVMRDHIDAVKSMKCCENILREFADMIGSARARLYIANCATEIKVAA